MKKLNNYKFCELYEMSSGISTKAEQAGHGYPFLSFSTIFNNYYIPNILEEKMDTSEKERNIYSIKKGDIFLTRTSETLNELAMSCVALKDYDNATYSGFAKRLRPLQNDITYDKFMAFYLRSKYFRKIIDNNAIMTLRASFNENIFSYINLLLLGYKEQEKIGDFLYNISEIIIKNNNINKNYFKFIDKSFQFYIANKTDSNERLVFSEELNFDIPESWKVVKVGDICKIKSGYAFKTKDYVKDGNYRLLTIKNVQDNYVNMECDNYINKLDSTIPSYCKLNIGDILISLTGNVGRIGLVYDNKCLLNQRVGVFKLNDEKYLNYIYSIFQSDWMKKKIEKISTGTSQKNVSPLDIEDIYIPMPNDKVLQKFIDNNSIIESITKNEKESFLLKKYIEHILQMCINGQITIK